MSKTTVRIVSEEDLNFVLNILELDGATTTVEKVGDNYKVTAVFPDVRAARNSVSLTTPAPLATDTAEEAEPAYLPTTEKIKPPIATGGFEELAAEYRRNYDLFSLVPGHDKEIELRLAKVRAGEKRYAALAQQTGVPWQFIGVLHMMESNCNFATHLHNGDPLIERTRRVPAGRPLKGDPPFTWEESAIDALEYEGFTKATGWNIAAMLYRCERYNGMGYRKRGIHSPYLWSYSNLYKKGRFTEDHHFDPNSVSRQCGVAILLKQLLA